MQLVPDWKSAWKWFSVHAFALLAALPVIWPQIPPEVQAWLPPEWRPWVLVLIALGGLAGRVVSQTKE